MRHFPDKPALLKAVFERNIKAIRLPDLSVGSDLRSSLERLIGERLVIPDAPRDRQIGAAHGGLRRRILTSGGRLLCRMLKKPGGLPGIIGRARVLSIKDPDLAAEQLIVSWLGMSQLRQNLGVAGPPSADAIARRIRYATDTMVRAWSTPVLVAGGGKARSGRTRTRRRTSSA
jgi:TetR/AcrR family transcriptional repressor of mexJK operon